MKNLRDMTTAELEAQLEAVMGELGSREGYGGAPELLGAGAGGGPGARTSRVSEEPAAGVLVKAEELAALGDVVVLTFRIPGSAQWVDTQARVVQVAGSGERGAPGVGLELLDLGPLERELLARGLAGVRSGASQPTERSLSERSLSERSLSERSLSERSLSERRAAPRHAEAEPVHGSW
jgi:hypothetical protein